MSLYAPLFEALDACATRYVVVGGVATVLHGHARLTADIDLVLDLDPGAARSALDALERLGLQPRLPVVATQFADPAVRRRWVEERGMQVFSLWAPANPLLSVDLFVDHPIEFEGLWARAEVCTLGGIAVRIASIRDLIALKRLAGRPRDLEDIAALEALAQARGDGEH